ncbi:hypothetical protein VTN02DRAFT_2301 [Thermoascus thermophilus]
MLCAATPFSRCMIIFVGCPTGGKPVDVPVRRRSVGDEVWNRFLENMQRPQTCVRRETLSPGAWPDAAPWQRVAITGRSETRSECRRQGRRDPRGTARIETGQRARGQSSPTAGDRDSGGSSAGIARRSCLSSDALTLSTPSPTPWACGRALCAALSERRRRALSQQVARA